MNIIQLKVRNNLEKFYFNPLHINLTYLSQFNIFLKNAGNFIIKI